MTSQNLPAVRRPSPTPAPRTGPVLTVRPRPTRVIEQSAGVPAPPAVNNPSLRSVVAISLTVSGIGVAAAGFIHYLAQ